MKIRELAQYHWYLVFKLNVSDFMFYKDPSFILREMIKDVYEETGSFEIYQICFLSIISCIIVIL